MFKESGLLIFYAHTPVHMGAGESVSYVDKPIQREKHTSYPVLWSSGIKGVFRELATRVWEDKNSELVEVIFGPGSNKGKDESSECASCISFTDARILFYPVRSLKGVFAWVTCPFVLKRFQKDLKNVGKNETFNIPEPNGEDKIIICSKSKLDVTSNKKQVVLEEFIFDVDSNKTSNCDNIISPIEKYLPTSLVNSFGEHFCIVSDDVFKDFVNYAVEIRTRIRIDQETGTAQEGALFSEELIPSDSVFYSLILINKPLNKNSEFVKESRDVKERLKTLFDKTSLIQLGADDTTGKGFMEIKFTNAKESKNGTTKNS